MKRSITIEDGSTVKVRPLSGEHVVSPSRDVIAVLEGKIEGLRITVGGQVLVVEDVYLQH